MKTLFTLLFVTLISVTGLVAQDGDAAFVAGWTAPVPSWFAGLPAVKPVKMSANASLVTNFDAANADFDAEWAKIAGAENVVGGESHRLGLAGSEKGAADFTGSFKVAADESNIYILLKYTDDDVTGNETVEVAWAPYDTITAPVIEALPQAWYARYQQFGAYKATFKKTGFDAAMMIDGSTGTINWGGTNDILSNNLYIDDRSAVGSTTVKQIITIGYAALTGEARPEFDLAIWKAINSGKGISFEMKVNDVDTDDAFNTDETPVQKPAEYWWNTTNNDAYALTAYAGYLTAPVVAQDGGDAAFVAGWTAPVPSWFAGLPAVKPVKMSANASLVTNFDAANADFDAEWAKIAGAENVVGGESHRLGLAGSEKGAADFTGSFKVAADESNIYILLKYTDDDVTGNETVEVAWAPYDTITAPVIEALPQAWYARYQQFGAYKATFKKTGFDAAMMIDGSTGTINWGGTNDILSNNLYIDDRSAVGSTTVKQIITIGYAALTGEARPEFDLAIWKAINSGKGISFEMKVNDVDTDDAFNTDETPVQKPAEYWWNTTNNDAYALTAYAGYLTVDKIIDGIEQPISAKSIFEMVTPNLIKFNKLANVSIYNILGAQLVVKRNVNQIDISNLNRGIYIIRANNESLKIVR